MIDFSGYTYAAILKQMLGQVPKSIDTRQGSMIQTALGPAAWYLEGVYMLLNQLQQNAYADTAVGQALEYICAERGISRKAAVPAVRKGTFNREIPEGSVFRTMNGELSVSFTSGALLEKTDDSYTYEMTCATAGAEGNTYTGKILPLTALTGLTEAVIGEIITAGSDEESDESLRARYFETFEAVAFGGNLAAYRSAILAIAGVGAVQVYPASSWKGGGTVLCSIISSEYKPVENALIEEVQAVICPSEAGEDAPSPNGYGMAPIGAAVTITTAKVRALNIACQLQFVEGAPVSADVYQERVEQAIEGYLSTVRKSWGTPIKGQEIQYAVSVYVSRISMAILSIEEIVNVTNVTINGSAADLALTETSALQEIPILGTVTINGG